MEIERINEHTVKFYMSYGDIEDRGFDREEIWYNRERSEELFWKSWMKFMKKRNSLWKAHFGFKFRHWTKD